jgi:hypothetical protein
VLADDEPRRAGRGRVLTRLIGAFIFSSQILSSNKKSSCISTIQMFGTLKERNEDAGAKSMQEQEQ